MAHEETHMSTEEKVVAGIFICIIAGFIGNCVYRSIEVSREIAIVPNIELVSMDFTVHNITESRLNVKWDLSIRIPDDLAASCISPQGDVQASLLYKNVTLAISPQKYYNLKLYNPKILKVSALVSDDDDISSSTAKDIIEDIEKKKEVQFAARFSLTDSREKTSGVMSYACDEVTLRFEHGSEMKAKVFGKYPNCINI